MAILIVGLGNPGKEYEKTRHNAGFLAVDALAEKFGVNWKLDKQSRAAVAELSIDGTKVVLAKPQTFMNLSGEAVAALCGRYKLGARDVWVVYDEASITDRQVRTRVGGSSGGHNGVKSIMDHIGEDFARFRIGVGSPSERIPLEDYVLQKFSQTELDLMKQKIEIANDMIVAAFTEGVQEHTITIPE